MPTNIAESIRGGHKQNMADLGQLNTMANVSHRTNIMDRNTQLAENAQKMQVQSMIDQQGHSIMQVADQLTIPVSQTKNDVKKALDALELAHVTANSAGDVDDATTEQFSKVIREAEASAQKAETANRAAMDRRDDYIMGLLRTPGAMAILKNMSLADEDIVSKLFNENVFESLNETEKEEWIGRWTAIVNAENQANAQVAEQAHQVGLQRKNDNAYQTEEGKVRARTEHGLTPAGTVPKDPESVIETTPTVMTRKSFENGRKKFDMDIAEADNFYDNFITPVNRERLSKTPNRERDLINNFFSLWSDPNSAGQKVDTEATIAALEQVQPGVVSESTREVLMKYQELLKMGKENYIGAYVDTLKKSFRTPRVTAESN